MSPDELERILNRQDRGSLIGQVVSEYSQSSTPGRIHKNEPVEVFWPNNTQEKPDDAPGQRRNVVNKSK